MCEFRSRQLVGLAAMDLNQRNLYLSQYGDNHTYSTTAMWIQEYIPHEVLVPDKMGMTEPRATPFNFRSPVLPHVEIMLTEN